VLDVTLLVLKAAFVVLLYLFVYLVVRQALRGVNAAAMPAQAPDVVLPAPVPASQAVPPATPAERRRRRQRRHDERTTPGQTFDLTAHITPRLVVVSSPVLEPGTTIELEGWVMFGRAPSSDVLLDEPFVSQTHARVVPRGQMHFIEDLGSTNGTFVNGREVVEAQLLLDSEIRVGETVFRYEE
jgi:hypothetical protein